MSRTTTRVPRPRRCTCGSCDCTRPARSTVRPSRPRSSCGRRTRWSGTPGTSSSTAGLRRLALSYYLSLSIYISSLFHFGSFPAQGYNYFRYLCKHMYKTKMSFCILQLFFLIDDLKKYIETNTQMLCMLMLFMCFHAWNSYILTMKLKKKQWQMKPRTRKNKKTSQRYR